jgi:hypothetical protein
MKVTKHRRVDRLVRQEKLSKTPNSGALVRKDIKDRVKFGDLEKVADLLREVKQFQIAALVLHSGKPTDELTDARAVNVIHVGKIQKDLLSLIIQKSPDCFSQQGTAVAQDDAAAQVHDGNVPGIPMCST